MNDKTCVFYGHHTLSVTGEGRICYLVTNQIACIKLLHMMHNTGKRALMPHVNSEGLEQGG